VIYAFLRLSGVGLLHKFKPTGTRVYLAVHRREFKEGPERGKFSIDYTNRSQPAHQKSDDEVDSVLDKTITLFRFITEKDSFERYYKSHLARRLLLNRSVSDDAERGMLAKLKVECGFQFTKKMEGMFNDMKLSTDVMVSYHDYLAKATVR
jgi:cullin 3